MSSFGIFRKSRLEDCRAPAAVLITDHKHCIMRKPLIHSRKMHCSFALCQTQVKGLRGSPESHSPCAGPPEASFLTGGRDE